MQWTGTPSVLGSGATQLALLTLSIAGLQFAWGIEQAYVNVYLLDLGIAKSTLSLIWVAGPVCGLVVQPITGVLSDHSTSSRGRRRPFMVWGALLVAAGLVAFGYCREVADLFNLSPKLVAVYAILGVDITINVCQACCRALIVDVLPAHRQVDANSWAGRMASGGHLLSYVLCSTDMTKLGFASQLKGVCIISSVLLVVAVSITSAAVTERVLVQEDENAPSIIRDITIVVTDLWIAATHLDKTLAAIFKVQLFGWYSWFTFLFYGTTYAGEIWQLNKPDHGPDARAIAGSRAFVVFGAASTFFSTVLPLLRTDIVTLWSRSYIVYAAATFYASITQSYTALLSVFGVVGLSWAMTLWAPFALTAERIHELPPVTSDEEHLVDEESQVGEAILVETASTSTDLSHIPEGHNEKAGVYLGIHNCALTLPQFVSTFGSYVIFRIIEADHPDDHSGLAIATTFKVGVLTALLAAAYARNVNNFRHMAV